MGKEQTLEYWNNPLNVFEPNLYYIKGDNDICKQVSKEEFLRITQAS